MRVTVERSHLLKSLGHVHRVVERRNTIPILSNVLMRAEGAACGEGTDLDLEVTEPVPADVGQPGATTVPAHILYDIVRKLPDGARGGAGLRRGRSCRRSGRSRFSLQVLAESDFPDLAAGEFSTASRCRQFAKKLIDNTQFAISTEETRYYLNGIYLHVADRRRQADAARGRDRRPPPRPGAVRRAGGCGGDDRRDRAAEDRQRGAEADRGSGGRGVDRDLRAKIRFTIGAVVLTSKLIDGTFPDYPRHPDRQRQDA